MCWLQFAAVSATTAQSKKRPGGKRSSPFFDHRPAPKKRWGEGDVPALFFFDTHVSETKRTLSTRDVERATTGGGSNARALSNS